MLYAIHDGSTTIVAAADSVAELEAFFSRASTDPAITECERPSAFDMMADDRYAGFRVPPVNVSFDSTTDRESFIERFGINVVKRNMLRDKHDDMLIAQEQDPYSGEADDKRTIGEIYNLTQDDPWDDRSDEKKAHDEEMKRLYDEAKKAGKLSGDSFASPKDPTVQITEVRSTQNADGTIRIDDILAVKGLHDNSREEIEEAEAAARSVDDGDDDNDETSCEPRDYIFHVSQQADIFADGDIQTVATVTPRKYFEKYGRVYDQHLAIRLPDGFEEIMEATFTYAGTVEEARQALLDGGFKESKELGDFLDGLAAVMAEDSVEDIRDTVESVDITSYNPDLLKVMQDLDRRTGGLIGIPQSEPDRDPSWEKFEITIDGDPGWEARKSLGLPYMMLAAAGLISIDVRDDAQIDARWGGHSYNRAEGRYRFTFWGKERETQRLMALIHSVTDLPVEATRADNAPMPLDLDVAQHIDPEGQIAIYFRVDLEPSGMIADEEMFVAVLKETGMEDKFAARGATPEGWWVAFQREFDAEQFTKAIDGIFAHIAQPWEMYGVNDRGERLVPKGMAAVVDPARVADPDPRPWNDRADEFHAMDEEAKAANCMGMKGGEFIFCGSYRGAEIGCVLHVTPKAWFDAHGTMWPEALNIAHLLPSDLKEVEPGLYVTRSRDWNNLSFDMAKRGFTESWFLQLHLNSL